MDVMSLFMPTNVLYSNNCYLRDLHYSYRDFEMGEKYYASLP